MTIEFDFGDIRFEGNAQAELEALLQANIAYLIIMAGTDNIPESEPLSDAEIQEMRAKYGIEVSADAERAESSEKTEAEWIIHFVLSTIAYQLVDQFIENKLAGYADIEEYSDEYFQRIDEFIASIQGGHLKITSDLVAFVGKTISDSGATAEKLLGMD